MQADERFAMTFDDFPTSSANSGSIVARWSLGKQVDTSEIVRGSDPRVKTATGRALLGCDLRTASTRAKRVARFAAAASVQRCELLA